MCVIEDPSQITGCDLRQGSSYYARDGVKGATIIKVILYLGGWESSVTVLVLLSDNTRPPEILVLIAQRGIIIIITIVNCNNQPPILHTPPSPPRAMDRERKPP